MIIQHVEGVNSETAEEKVISSDDVAAASIELYSYPKDQDLKISVEEPAFGDALMTSLVGSEREDCLQFHSDVLEGTFASENNGGTQQNQQPELWEQLLDSDLHRHSQNEDKCLLDPGNRYTFLEGECWKEVTASPGNPFTDGEDRPKKLSETNGFGFQVLGQHPSSLCLEPGEGGQEQPSVLHDGITTEQNQVALVQASASNLLPSAKEAMSCQKKDEEPSAVADDCYMSQEEVVIFEAPSFMSLVDPEAQELVRVSMPEQARRNFSASNRMDSKDVCPETSCNIQPSASFENLNSNENRWDVLIDSIRLSRKALTSTSHVTINDSTPRGTTILSGTGSLKSVKQAQGLSSTGAPTPSPRQSWFSCLKFTASPARNVPFGFSPHFTKTAAWKTESMPPAAAAAADGKLDNSMKTDKEKPKSMWLTYVCCCNKRP